MNAYLHILKQSMLQRRSVGGAWFNWLLGLSPLILGTLFGAFTGKWEFALRLGMLTMALPCIVWWQFCLMTYSRQNQPEYACLVPGLRRRLIAVTAAVWLAASLVMATGLALVLGHFALCLLACGALLLVTAGGQRYRWIMFMPTFTVLAQLGDLTGLPRPAVLLAAYGETTVAIAGLALLCGAAAWLIPAIYPRGSDWHWKRAKAVGQFQAVLGGAAPAQAKERRWQGLWLSGYAAALRSACARPQSGRLLHFGLGPASHWSGPVQQCVLVLLTVLALVLLAKAGWRLRAFPPGDYLATLVLAPAVAFVYSALAAMHATAREQAVLLLSPAAPDARRLNHWTARTLYSQFIIVWCACAAGAALVGMAVGDRGAVFALSMAAAVLPLGRLLLRDYAALPAPVKDYSFLAALLAMLACFAGYAAFRHLVSPLPWPLFGVACVMFAVVGTTRQWRWMMAVRPALPCARLA